MTWTAKGLAACRRYSLWNDRAVRLFSYLLRRERRETKVPV